MTGILGGLKWGRLLWTVLVVLYFIVFFRNFFTDALNEAALPAVVAAYLVVFWLAVEYYFGSPFFQSGVVEHSAFWRGVFAFFVYPLLGYVAADSIWWHWTQIPMPWPIRWIPGMALFGLGTYVRLATLSGLVGGVGAGGGSADRLPLPPRTFVGLRLQRRCRHPRYFATMLQLFGLALTFGSWGGVAAVLLIGVPLILVQVRHEDRLLLAALRGESRDYAASVPMLLPRIRLGGPRRESS